MNETEETVWPTNWPEWVLHALNELEAAENEMVTERVPNDAPEWVKRIAVELVKLTVPTVKLSAIEKTGEITESGPQFLGKMIGHFEWLLENDNGLIKQLERAKEAFERFDQEMRRKLSKKAYARLQKEGEKYQPDVDRFFAVVEKMLVAKATAITAVKKLVDQQPWEEKKAFYDGYTPALDAAIFADDGHFQNEKLTSTTNIYVLLCIFWRVVKNKIPSITLLHAWLCRVLGAQQVGQVGRVKMICHRMRITLGPRGRPRKRK